jgi:hypothetical protein
MFLLDAITVCDRIWSFYIFPRSSAPPRTICTTIHRILRVPRRIVGQVFRGTPWVRRIVNPPAARGRARPGLGESPPPFPALPCGAQPGERCLGKEPLRLGVVERAVGRRDTLWVRLPHNGREPLPNVETPDAIAVCDRMASASPPW